MSHITKQSERDENQEIWNCPYRAVGRYVSVYNDWTGETDEEWRYENECGDVEHISIAKDRCKRCGKTFTY